LHLWIQRDSEKLLLGVVKLLMKKAPLMSFLLRKLVKPDEKADRKSAKIVITCEELVSAAVKLAEPLPECSSNKKSPSTSSGDFLLVT
jgi:hypothetical protein